MMRLSLRIWGLFPVWVHTLAAIILRPRFRMAVAALVFDEQGRVRRVLAHYCDSK